MSLTKRKIVVDNTTSPSVGGINVDTWIIVTSTMKKPDDAGDRWVKPSITCSIAVARDARERANSEAEFDVDKSYCTTYGNVDEETRREFMRKMYRTYGKDWR